MKLLTLPEVADRLGVHYETVRTWVHSGKLQGRRLAGRRTIQVLESDLGAFLEDAKVGPEVGPLSNAKSTESHLAPLKRVKRAQQSQPHEWRRAYRGSR